MGFLTFVPRLPPRINRQGSRIVRCGRHFLAHSGYAHVGLHHNESQSLVNYSFQGRGLAVIEVKVKIKGKILTFAYYPNKHQANAALYELRAAGLEAWRTR